MATKWPASWKLNFDVLPTDQRSFHGGQAKDSLRIPIGSATDVQRA